MTSSTSPKAGGKADTWVWAGSLRPDGQQFQAVLEDEHGFVFGGSREGAASENMTLLVAECCGMLMC